MRRFVVATLFGVALAAAGPSSVLAQETEEGGRAAAFESASGPARETVPGGTLLVLAYAVIWLAILVFVSLQWRRTLHIESEVERLRRALDGKSTRASGEEGGGGP